VEACYGLEQGALARPVVPDKSEHFPFPDVQIYCSFPASMVIPICIRVKRTFQILLAAILLIPP
jgi:hypothetical protein